MRTKSAILIMTVFLAALVSVLAGRTMAQSQKAAVQPKASPAASIGLFVYPTKGQTAQQQANDENACYTAAKQQTGIDPTAPPPPQQVEAQKGGGAKGAARGAAGGAAVGGITGGDAGSGAAAGAAVGAVRGRRQQRKANEQAQQQAVQQAEAQQQQSLDTFRRSFSACMDARGYSVK